MPRWANEVGLCPNQLSSFILHVAAGVAIVPASLSLGKRSQAPHLAVGSANYWVRRALVFMVLGLVAVFGVALWLNPYEVDGTPRRMETHLQLGLPPCTFRMLTGLPCPSCGMTTSFALLVRGDLRNSLLANAVGTLLALFCLILIPWGIACVACNRLLLIGNIERALIWVVIVFVGLLLARWLIVLGFAWA
jgi:hypothetical protein